MHYKPEHRYDGYYPDDISNNVQSAKTLEQAFTDFKGYESNNSNNNDKHNK